MNKRREKIKLVPTSSDEENSSSLDEVDDDDEEEEEKDEEDEEEEELRRKVGEQLNAAQQTTGAHRMCLQTMKRLWDAHGSPFVAALLGGVRRIARAGKRDPTVLRSAQFVSLLLIEHRELGIPVLYELT